MALASQSTRPDRPFQSSRSRRSLLGARGLVALCAAGAAFGGSYWLMRGDATDVVRNFLQPRCDVGQTHGAFRLRIKIEPERVDARLDRRVRILFAGESADFDAGAAAVEPTPQSVRDHVSSACGRGPA